MSKCFCKKESNIKDNVNSKSNEGIAIETALCVCALQLCFVLFILNFCLGNQKTIDCVVESRLPKASWWKRWWNFNANASAQMNF